jgi:hypothetical protein
LDSRQRAYLEYYEARARKYDGHPLYPNLAVAERALCDALREALRLEDFRERLRRDRLELRCAIARVRDTAMAEATFYEEIAEPVRAEPHREVLRALDAQRFDDVQQLTRVVNEIHVRWQVEISRDEMLRSDFWNDWKVLEDLECEEVAEVPARWREERARRAADTRARAAAHWREHWLPGVRRRIPDYTPDWDALWAKRHRRCFPVPDDVLAQRLAEHPRLLGVR